MRAVTDFADLAVLLPVAVLLGAGLALGGWARGAAGWAIAVGGTLLAMLAIKLLFLGCSAGAMSPSGHTAAGTIVYGGALALYLRRRWGAIAACLAAGIFMSATIGATRLALGLHGPGEIAIGAAVGVAGIALLLRLAGPPPGRLRTAWLAPALAIALLLHGTRLAAEPRLRAWAGWLPPDVCDALHIF